MHQEGVRGDLTAKEGGGAPRPAGFATPGPAARVDGIPPGALFPSLALGSAGGGDSTEREMMWAPRTMVRPRVRFSSVSTIWEDEPGADGLLAFRFTRLNSSVSARTRFMCYSSISFPLSTRRELQTCAYLVESKHLTGHGTPIIEGDAHSPVDLYVPG